ncbi:BCCT family transporter [Paracoccus saliphilus]|uniref:BCCT family transporter n=1 Tax=Paracoccus saliphilus TaxID=405559 RepID=A0AA45W673_9RHOB|nr:BCCT family transporter [Paracoccus saliphilus]WCR01497.1 BCCT family transporter [Paracoccus saliphilus]SIS99620.1 choline/glycine/proline betaine transport protein [Paracoccus saliphilus]
MAQDTGAPPKDRMVSDKGPFKGLHNGMSIASKAMVAAFVVFTVLNVELAGKLYGSIRSWVESALNWYYISSVVVLFFICLFLMFSRFGSIRLGDDDSRPEFSNFSWFAMLFSASVSIGIMFFGVAEPLFYFDNSAGWGYPNNPFADRLGHTGLTPERAVDAVRVTNFHWGLHGWAIYTITGLCLGYFAFRKKLPLTFRSALYPILGDRIYGPAGHAVDLLAIFGTVFGIATSLGLGATQMAQGMNVLFGVDSGILTQVLLVLGVSVVATLSAVSGIGRGIKILSEWNIILTIALILFFLFAGPTQWLVGFFLNSLGAYVTHFVPMGFWTASEPGDAAWQGGWTIFYWGWWLSWAPFVGMFIARISKGRTIREFMFGAMLVPTAMAFIWISIFGGNALFIEMNAVDGVGTAGLIEMVNNWNLGGTLFGTIDGLAGGGALTWVISALATLLLATWFITSSDSGTLVVTTILSMGNPHPPKRYRIIWGGAQALVAAVLLMAGGLGALQTASIAAALPTSILVVLMAVGVLKSLMEDPSAEIAHGGFAPDGTALDDDLRG